MDSGFWVYGFPGLCPSRFLQHSLAKMVSGQNTLNPKPYLSKGSAYKPWGPKPSSRKPGPKTAALGILGGVIGFRVQGLGGLSCKLLPQ